MDIARYKHQIIVIGLLAFTSLGILFMGDVRLEERLGVVTNLPDNIADFHGTTPLFCQSIDCMQAFLQDDLDGATNCPSCSGGLDTISLSENVVLPKDTVSLKKVYTSADKNTYNVSIILAGTDRRSIHRPQNCLPAQGFRIDNSRRLSIPIEGTEPIKVQLLEIRQPSTQRNHKDERYLYTYWYAGPDYDTSSQATFYFSLARARLFHNIAERWALVSVQTFIQEDSQHEAKQLSAFISLLHPIITAPRTTEREQKRRQILTFIAQLHSAIKAQETMTQTLER